MRNAYAAGGTLALVLALHSFDGDAAVYGEDERRIVPREKLSEMPFSAMGIITMSDESACSATLIQRDLIVTASHCIKTDGKADGPLDPRITFRTGDDRNPGPAIRARIEVDGPTDPNRTNTANEKDNDPKNNDYAFLRLERAANTDPVSIISGKDLSAAKLNTLGDKPTVGQILVQLAPDLDGEGPGRRIFREHRRKDGKDPCTIRADDRRYPAKLTTSCDTQEGGSGGPFIYEVPNPSLPSGKKYYLGAIVSGGRGERFDRFTPQNANALQGFREATPALNFLFKNIKP